MKKILFFIILFLAFPTLAGGLNASFNGSRYSGMTRTSTVAEYWGVVDGSNNLIDMSGENLLDDRTELDSWTQGGTCAVTADQFRNPIDGTMDADYLDNTGDTSGRRYNYTDDLGDLTGRTFTYSVWVRADTPHNISLRMYERNIGWTEIDDQILATTQWKRVSITGTCTGGDPANDFAIHAVPSEYGVVSGQAYFYGAQVIENDEWRTNMGTFLNPTDQSVTKPALDLADTNDPTSAYTDLQSSDGNRLPAREYDDTASQDYQLAHHDSMNVFDDDFTLTFLLTRGDTSQQYFFEHGAYHTDGIDIRKDNCITYVARLHNNSNHIQTSITQGTCNQFNIYQLVRSGSTFTSYLNGVAGTTVDPTGYGIDGNQTMYLGSRGANYFDGKIGYVRLDAEALSTDELAADRERLLGIATNWSRDNAWTFTRSTTAYKQFSSGGANALTPTLVSITKNTPRVAGKGGGVLIEAYETNQCFYSEEFDAAGTDWGNTRCSVINDTEIALNGETTADTIHEDNTAASTHSVYQQNIACTNGNTYTFSVYLKAINRDWVKLEMWDGGGVLVGNAFFDVATCQRGATGGGATTKVEALNDGWCRCSITDIAGATGNTNLYIRPAEADTDDVFDGLDQDSLYVWGAQFEELYFASSYIPTPTNASVSRTNDDLTIDPHPASTNEYIVPELFSPNTPADKLSVYLEAKCHYSGVADIGISRQLLEISGNAGTAGGTRNRFRVYVGSDGRVYSRIDDDSSTQHRVASAVDVVDYDQWFTIRTFYDFSDLSRIDLWVNESNTGMTYTANTGTGSFDTTNTLIRLGQTNGAYVNGNCRFRNIRINNKEIMAP